MTTSYEIGACPVCASSAGEELLSSEDLRTETEHLWTFHLKRLDPEIPAEHLLDRVAFSQDPPIRLERCTECGTVYRNPREQPRELMGIYEGEEPDSIALKSLHESQREAYQTQARRLTEIAGRTGTGLEIGSYVGAFLAAAQEEGWDFTGVDVNRTAVEFSRSLGFKAVHGSLEEVDVGRVDAVTIWNCFDQLADPRGTLREARSRLNPRGIVTLRVPNGEFYARVRGHLEGVGPAAAIARELLAQNNLLGFPYRFGFTPSSIRRLLEAEGFECLRVVGDSLVPIADEWTRWWAAGEERVVKVGLKAAARLGLPAPWLEVYAEAKDRSE